MIYKIIKVIHQLESISYYTLMVYILRNEVKKTNEFQSSNFFNISEDCFVCNQYLFTTNQQLLTHWFPKITYRDFNAKMKMLILFLAFLASAQDSEYLKAEKKWKALNLLDMMAVSMEAVEEYRVECFNCLS